MSKAKFPPNQLLRQERLKRNWSQSDLARMVEVSTDTVRSWETGLRRPSPVNQTRLCQVFNLPPERLGLPSPVEATDAPVSHTLISQDALPLPIISQTEITTSAHRTTFHPLNLFPSHWKGDRDRQKMLAKIRQKMQGKLQRSLRHATLITLGLVNAPEALAHPWRFELQRAGECTGILPDGTSLFDVYTHIDGQFLILGEGGIGKTTLVHELTRQLAEQAEQQVELPIPVIVSLASWTQQHGSLVNWLVEAVHNEYSIARSVIQEWLESDQLALFLDGLDETLEEERVSCVKAINTYHQEHASVPLIVSSRQKDYFARATRLDLPLALIVQPLSDAQVETYLSQANGQLDAMRAAIQEDAQFRKMVRLPLLLNLAVLSYLGDETMPVFTGSPEERMQAIFERYTERMLDRKDENVPPPYPRSQVLSWLSWLAYQMRLHRQPTFYLERLQPDWLPNERSLRQYRLAIIRVIFSLISMVSAGSFALFRGDSFPKEPGLFFWVGGGQGNTILGWMAPGLGGGLRGAASFGIILVLVTVLATVLARRGGIPPLTKQALKRGIMTGLRQGVLIGSLVGLFAGLVFLRAQGWASGLLYGGSMSLFGGLIVGLMSGLITLLQDENPQMRHTRPQAGNTSSFRLPDRFLNAALFSGCAVASFIGIYSWQSGGINQFSIIYGLIVGFFFGLVYGLGNGTDLIWGLGMTIQPAETVHWSWKAVRKDLAINGKRGIMLGLAIVVGVTIIIAGISSLFHGPTYGLHYGFVYGLIVGCIAGIVGMVTGILTSGWSSTLIEDESLFVRPNEGIHRSLNHALIAACFFGPLGGLASGLSCGGAFGLVGGLTGWFTLGLGVAIILTVTFALQFFILYGGSACLEHLLLRWLLWRKGLLPWHATTMLDYADACVLLGKQGGGYTFYHPMLQDYFVHLYTTPSPMEEHHV